MLNCYCVKFSHKIQLKYFLDIIYFLKIYGGTTSQDGTPTERQTANSATSMCGRRQCFPASKMETMEQSRKQ